MRLALLALGAALCTTAWCGPAHADTADLAVRYFCGPGFDDLAPIIRTESRHHLTRAPRLALLMFAESGCHADRVNAATGATGLFGIMPGRSADPDHLDADELKDPETNAHLGARHLANLISLCGSFAGALHVFHSKDGQCKNWHTDSHVARLLKMERAFWTWARRLNQRRS